MGAVQVEFRHRLLELRLGHREIGIVRRQVGDVAFSSEAIGFRGRRIDLFRQARVLGEDDDAVRQHFFLQKLNETEEKKVEKIDPDFIEALQAYEWPGNVRELRNVINRAFIMARTDTLTVECLPDKFLGARKRRGSNAVTIPLGQPMEEVERLVIEETLNMTDGDRKKTAEILGISYKTLYNKTKKYKQSDGDEEEE